MITNQANEFTAAASSVGKRLDVFVAEAADLTRSHAQKLIEQGAATVTSRGKSVEPNKKYQLKDGDIVAVTLPELRSDAVEPENLPLEIVYEDDDLAVINKAKGVVVHPSAGHDRGTLVGALLYHMADSLSGINGVCRPGIVHRIDKDTSGLLIIAKNDAAHLHLAAQIKAHTAFRIYHAILCGNLNRESGTVDAPIGRSPRDRKRQAVVAGGREAITHYAVIERYHGACYAELRLETGRTHQIRVHMAHIGHPVYGDVLYGGAPSRRFTGQCLHAKIIEFTHPRTGERLRFESDLPEYFIEELNIRGRENHEQT